MYYSFNHMRNRPTYQASSFDTNPIKGVGTRALEDEFAVFILNHGAKGSIVRLEEEFGVDLTTVRQSKRIVTNAHSLWQ